MRGARRSPSASAEPTLQTRLRDLRTGAELTQAALADRVGVTRQTIIAIERGGYVPSVALALELAHVLSTPVEELFWLGLPEGEAA